MSKCFNGAVEIDSQVAKGAWVWWSKRNSGASKWVISKFNEEEQKFLSQLSWWDKFCSRDNFRKQYTGYEYEYMAVVLIAAGACTAEELNEKFGWEKFVLTDNSWKGKSLYRQREIEIASVGDLVQLGGKTVLVTPEQARAISLLLAGQEKYDYPF